MPLKMRIKKSKKQFEKLTIDCKVQIAFYFMRKKRYRIREEKKLIFIAVQGCFILTHEF